MRSDAFAGLQTASLTHAVAGVAAPRIDLNWSGAIEQVQTRQSPGNALPSICECVSRETSWKLRTSAASRRDPSVRMTRCLNAAVDRSCYDRRHNPRGSDDSARPSRTDFPWEICRDSIQVNSSHAHCRAIVLAIVVQTVLLATGQAPSGQAQSWKMSPRVSTSHPGSTRSSPALATPILRASSVWENLFCGGSLVAPSLVLTAAHCVVAATPDQLAVVVGRT